jgi:hypothetical protein
VISRSADIVRTLQYENIKNAHIVPASYLGQFAMDGKIGVRIVREEKDLVPPIEKVGRR